MNNFILSPKKIKELRHDFGLTQSQLSNILSVYIDTVSSWERGKLKPSGLQAKILIKMLQFQSVNSSKFGMKIFTANCLLNGIDYFIARIYAETSLNPSVRL